MKLKRARKFFGLGHRATNKDVEDAYALCMRVLQRRFAESDDDEEMAAIRRSSKTLETIRDLAHKEEPPPPEPVAQPEVQETPAPAVEGEPSEYFLAPFRARVVAFALDYGIVYLLARAVGSSNPVTFFVALFVVYHAGLQWYMQRTLGKALMGLRVIRGGRRPITLAWSLGRSTIGYGVVDLFGLGLLTSWFDRKWRRCAHDFVFGSVVVSESLQRAGLKVLTMRLLDAARRFEQAHAEKLKRVAELAKPVTDYVESLEQDERVKSVRTVQSMWGRLIQVAVFLALLLDKIVTLLYGADQKLTIAAGAGGAAAGVLGAGGAAAGAALSAVVPAGMAAIPAALTMATTSAIVTGAAATVPGIRDAARAFASPTVSVRSESTFDKGREGWRVAGVSSGTDPVFRESDGNPGGHIQFREVPENEFATGGAPAAPLDIVLAIDGTGSMGPVFDQIRIQAGDIVRALAGIMGDEEEVAAQGGRDVRLGVVCFRDHRGKSDEDFQVLSMAAGAKGITAHLDTMKEEWEAKSIDGDNTREEDQHRAIMMALDMLGERKQARRAVVVITDAPPNKKDPWGNTAAKVAERVKAEEVMLFIITVESHATFKKVLESKPNATLTDGRSVAEHVRVRDKVYGDAKTAADDLAARSGGQWLEARDSSKVVDVLLETVKRVERPAGPWYWNAPPKFLRDLRNAYGRTLTFDLKHERPPQPGEEAVPYTPINAPDIVLRGGGMALVRALPYPVRSRAPYWTAYSIPLHETGGWTVVGRTEPPSAADVRSVLRLVGELKIRADFVEGVEANSLDNVFIREPE